MNPLCRRGLREGVDRIESRPMAIPETTSAEAFERYVGGKCLVACHGKAWRDIKAWIIAPLLVEE
jgi:hypothetical protein